MIAGDIGQRVGNAAISASSVFLERWLDAGRRSIQGRVLPAEAAILFPYPTMVSCFAGANHPSVLGIHPDNLDAAVDVLGALPVPMPQQGELSDFRGTILAVGSPTSNWLSGTVFGFGAESGWPQPNPLNLPATYDHHDRTQRSVVRWLRGRQHQTQRRGILISGDTSPRLVAVEPRTGWQLDDYLLVTVVPNFLDWDSALSGGKIWVIGGVHGVGTRAFSTVFSDPSIAGDLLKCAKEHAYFQALIHVSGVTHEDRTRSSEPTAVDWIECFPLDRERLLTGARDLELGCQTLS